MSVFSNTLVTLTHGQQILGLHTIDAPLAVNFRIVHLRSVDLIVDETLVVFDVDHVSLGS